MLFVFCRLKVHVRWFGERVHFVICCFVGSCSLRFLILPKISCPVFVVLCVVVVVVHVAHFVIVIVSRMTWLQKFFGWLDDPSVNSCW